MYTDKLCDDSSYIHAIYTDLAVIITFLVTKYNKVSFRYIFRKVYLPETKDLLSLSNSNDLVSHTSFKSSPTNIMFHY